MKLRDVLVYLLAARLVWIWYRKWQSSRKLLMLSQKPRRVILVPGLGGSRLYDAQGTLQWCNWQGFFPHVTNSWRDSLTVKYNPTTQTFDELNQHTPYRRPHWQGCTFVPTKDFGGCEGVGNVLSRNVKSSWQFQGILDAAHTLGYPTQGILGAPYDFRKITSPSVWTEYCRSLKALVEHACAESGESSVLLSHSMGSALLQTFFVLYLPRVLGERAAKTWKRRHIRRWVTVNGAFGGAGKAVRSFLSGDNNGMGYICDTGCHDWYQPMLENASGVLWMLPNPHVFPSSVPVVTVGEEAYSVSTLPTLLDKVSPLAAQAYRDTVMPLLGATFHHPGVPVVCVTSTQTGTPLQCTYPEDGYHHSKVTMSDERAYYNQSEKGASTGHMVGDGTVPYASLMVPQRWLESNEPEGKEPESREPVTFVRIKQENVGHTSILIEPNTVKLILTVVQ